MASCYKCGHPLMEEGPVALEAVCKQCSSWLHSCANCTHYDEYSNQKCREARAAYVYDRLGKNECTFFKVRQPIRNLERPSKDGKERMQPRNERDKEAKAREGLDKLFKS